MTRVKKPMFRQRNAPAQEEATEATAVEDGVTLDNEMKRR
jgi:hypothetical protein